MRVCVSVYLQVCMFCSSGYHMFSCQSEKVSRRWLSLDLAGVSVGLCGCYFPGAYYVFICWTVSASDTCSAEWHSLCTNGDQMLLRLNTCLLQYSDVFVKRIQIE